MAETAAHLVDHVIPPLPVRQWVLSVPRRLRWYLEREPHAVSAVLHILLRVIEAHLRASIPTASPRARLGAVSFVHRFGSALNRHVHLHCCIIDGPFNPGEDGQVCVLQAPVLKTDEMAAITEQVRGRVLRWFDRSALLNPDEARDMLAGPDRSSVRSLGGCGHSSKPTERRLLADCCRSRVGRSS